MKKSKNLNKKLLSYSLAAGAVMVSSESVQASISGQTDNHAQSSDDTYNISFNGSNKFQIRFEYQVGGNELGYIKGLTASAGFIRNGNYAKALAQSYTVSNGRSFANGTTERFMWTTGFPNGFAGFGDKYVGVRFNDGGIKYGWIKVNVTAGNDNTMTIVSHAYQTDGSSIKTDGVLPVELTSFATLVTLNSVKLKWETATEVNNYGFNIERSLVDGKQGDNEPEWEKIGFVEGHGNSNSPKRYAYEDKTFVSGKVYKYRLKQIDFNGAYEYSDELKVETTVPERAELAQNYPNPFNPSTTIKFSMPEADFAKLTVYNSIGEEVTVLINENLEPGFYTYLFDGSDLASGAYIYKLETTDRVITKKMLLVK